MPAPILTPRLKLIPATASHLRAEIGNRAEFAAMLQAEVPENWPPESTADALPLFLQWTESSPDRLGWFGWYGLTRGDAGNSPRLVASGGFMGPPHQGQADVGYSVLPQFQRQGFATEMVGALIRWAFADTAVLRIVAETEWANPASVRVLVKLGFAHVGPSADRQGTRFELSRPL